jgi:hypothetical protein
MANRRSRKQIHTFTHAKVTGDIPVYLVTEPEGVRFEIDLTVSKLTPRIPFCKSGDAIPALIAEATEFIESYLVMTWTKHVLIAATPILNADGVGIEITSRVIESTTWPAGKDSKPVVLWRDAATPWETRDTAVPSGFRHTTTQVLPWTADLESAAARLVTKVSSFSQSILAGLSTPQSAADMLVDTKASAAKA